ncbi:MAG: alpha/beta fold hydrolase [Anaerolineae bacterium]|nr:alpha/beta fold hydrolase [Anaerolineae bacterium]
MRFRLPVILIIILLSIGLIQAQESEATPEPLPPLPEAQLVEIEAADGLMLKGDFYLVDNARPTIFLIHELYARRSSWDSVLEPLLRAGYNVLAIDVRGHGATRGGLDWNRAIDDIALWFTWLREEAEVRPDAISTMGSSMGSTLTIIACANDAACRTTIAISPGWSYYGFSLEGFIAARPILVVYAERDRWPALGVPDMVAAAPNTLTVHTYTGNAHGMNLLRNELEDFTEIMLDWFAAYGS